MCLCTITWTLRSKSSLRAKKSWATCSVATLSCRRALGIEVALLTGQFDKASWIAATCAEVDGHHFDQLRLAGYRRLLERLAPLADPETKRTPHVDSDRSEFLYSAAIRSLRGGLNIGGSVLLDRFLRSGGPTDARLREEGRQHLDTARGRIARMVAPPRGSELLTALDEVEQQSQPSS